MHTTRRDLLRLGLGSSTLLACGATVPTFLARSARALDANPATSTKGKILVVVQLDGGNDGLNTVVPYRDDVYHRLRPRIGVSERDVLKIDDHVGFHPSLKGFSKLMEDGRLAIVQGVGYPNPNRSHFESMTMWQTARMTSDEATPGWLARALDHRAPVVGDAPAFHLHDKFPLPRALAGGQQMIPSLDRIEQFRRRIGMSEGVGADRQREALDRLSIRSQGESDSLLQFVERSSLITYASSARLETLQKNAPNAQGYPENFDLARRLRLISRLIKAGLTTSIYYTHLDGFDTHANQSSSHPELLRELGDSLKSFLDDLEKSGEADRVMVLVFSEFGRRVAENSSAGTDHGTAAPVFLLGKGVHAGLNGRYPDLSVLEDGDPKHAIDFRSVYSTLLERWLEAPSRNVLDGTFEPLGILRA